LIIGGVCYYRRKTGEDIPEIAVMSRSPNRNASRPADTHSSIDDGKTRTSFATRTRDTPPYDGS
jgi:hypothetical protein